MIARVLGQRAAARLTAAPRVRNLGVRKREEPVPADADLRRPAGRASARVRIKAGARVERSATSTNSAHAWWALAASSAALEHVQNELFDLGADLSVPFVEDDGRLRVAQDSIDRLEAECDEANARLEPLKSFVLPGGTEFAARLFFARAICRRAERRALAVERVNPFVPMYLNRLSDLLFILARAANGGAEILWKPGAPTMAQHGDD